jgi:hypothetical protein
MTFKKIKIVLSQYTNILFTRGNHKNTLLISWDYPFKSYNNGKSAHKLF